MRRPRFFFMHEIRAAKKSVAEVSTTKKEAGGGKQNCNAKRLFQGAEDMAPARSHGGDTRHGHRYPAGGTGNPCFGGTVPAPRATATQLIRGVYTSETTQDSFRQFPLPSLSKRKKDRDAFLSKTLGNLSENFKASMAWSRFGALRPSVICRCVRSISIYAPPGARKEGTSVPDGPV